MTTRCAVYARISHSPDGKTIGVDRQEKLCRALADARKWYVVDVYTDNDESAYTGKKKRPAYARMLADIEAGALDAIVAIDQDRIARTMSELAPFLDLCAKTSTTILLDSGEIDTTSADGRLKAQILGAVAENESAKKAERQRRAHEDAAERGRPFIGHRAYGYDFDNLTLLADEAKIVPRDLRPLPEGRSIALDRSIVERARCAHVHGEAREGNGRDVEVGNTHTLRAMLKNARYAGKRTHHGVAVADGDWTPIVTVEEHERAVALLQRHATPGRPTKHLLAGVVRCASCGWVMVTSAPKNAARRYVCTKRPEGGCGAMSINAEPLEEWIAEAIVFRLDSARFRRAAGKPTKKTKGVDVSLADIERQLDELATDHGNGEITKREWYAARAPLQRRREAALRSIAMETEHAALRPFTGADPSAVWEELSTDARRDVVRALIDRIDVRPVVTRGNVPERVDVLWKA